MFVLEIVAVGALTALAVYRQTVLSEVATTNRFTPAISYGIAGPVVAGFALPHGAVGYLTTAVGLVLSAVAGVVRGYRTLIWMEPDGRIVRQGTAVTILLFLGPVAAAVAMGVLSYLAGLSDGPGFGEVVVMIAIMAACESEIVYRRRQKLALAVRRVRASARTA